MPALDAKWLAVLCALVSTACRAPEPSAPTAPYWSATLDRCEAGELPACEEVQQEALRGWHDEERYEVGRRAASIACERNHARSCSLLAIFERSPSAKRSALERSCELGDAYECARLWRAYTWGDRELGLTGDLSAGLVWAERACSVNPSTQVSYCHKRVWALRDHPELAKSPEDVERALSLAHCAPNGLSPAECDTRIATIRMAAHDPYGDAFVDRQRANALAGARCNEGHLDACYLVGLLRLQTGVEERDPHAAMAIWDPACDRGHAASCIMTARFRLVRGPGYALSEAVERFRKGCGTDLDCHGRTGRILAYKRELRASIPFFATACEGGLSWSCADLGRVHVLLGRAVTRYEGALVSACEREHKESCLALARAYQRGLGVKRQPRLAATYRKRAHDLRYSTRYWRSMQRALEGKGSDLDDVNAIGSLTSLMPMVLMGLASATKLEWDFSEVPYGDP